MLKLETTGQFRRDYKKMMKRGYDRTLLEKVVDIYWQKKRFRPSIEIML